ncbi:MAG TPA: nucleotidyltransferase domain-containing protein [Candidatus Deferrimicrobium sp.]|nr:nucleotidyltransferase domain-containing protein [Candidatus Deferrimicrobium sp.]
MINLREIAQIAQLNHLPLIYLFGSKAQGKDSKFSDIDIAVLLEKNEDLNLRKLILNLIYEFSQIFHSDKIDLLILNKAGLDIQYNIVCEGKILYQLNENIRCNYETSIIKLYLDFQKYETEYYGMMHKTILQEGKDY